MSGMTTAILFPGQGSQKPAMREVVEDTCPELIERAASVVGEDPFARIEDGTRYVQPALYCASVALWKRAGKPAADFAAGHSLGELGALTAGGSLAVEDGVWLAARRGHLMQRMAEAHPGGGMLALLGDEDAAREIAAADGLTVANHNAPGQLVLSGPGDGLKSAAGRARDRGLKAMPLAVRGAFHIEAMAPALPEFEAALARIEVREPRVPVFSSITAHRFDDVRALLAQALVRPVRWRETLVALHALGVERFIEVGPGKVLRGLVRRTVPDARVETLGELEAAHA
jgi:[acyl-carrier-protein] S-malonyltransferase